MKNSKTKKKNTAKKTGGFLRFLILAFIVIIVANLAISYKSRIETVIVRTGSEESLIQTEGYIFRDQSVIMAPTDGYLYCEAAEDERVSRGETVMYIYKNQVNLAASSELKKVEQQISELSEGLRTADVFSSDTAKIEQTISQNLHNVPKSGARGDMSKVADISEAVNKLIEKRRIISGEIKPTSSNQELEKLKQQKAELEQKYNIERTIIHSPRTGAFTSRIDGLEEKLTLAALESIDSTYMKELNKLSAEAKTRDKVNAGEAIGKVVDNFGWSIAAQVSAREAEGIKVGDSLGIRFLDIGTDTVKGKVTKITPEESGKVILVVNSNKYVDMVYSMSKAKIELVRNSYEGLKIPAKSLRMTDGVMGVYVVKNDKARFVPIEVLYNGKDWIVAKELVESAATPKTLKLYDELIVSGKNIYEGKVVR